jgi:hypothetical protein
MFRNKLLYYHGTSQKRWKIIQQENKIKPSHVKKVGDYWITKGAYFVCENPYIALWYAHVASMHDKSSPVVLEIEYEADKDSKGEILNLLTSEGHMALAIAHKYFKDKVDDTVYDSTVNLDSVSLQMFMSNSPTLKGVIACFQEGKSFQNIIFENAYKNKYVPEQKGFSPGDHVEICFYPEFSLDKVTVKTITKRELLQRIDPDCNIWELVCDGLTEPLNNEKFKESLMKNLKSN